MNPNVLDASINESSSRWFLERCLLLQVSTRDYEYADSARSYIGFRTVQDYIVQTTGKGTRKNKIKTLLKF
jgi:hypothetical protein